MSFNDKASTNADIGGSQCYGERLAFAVPKNKKILKNYVDGLTGHGKALNRFSMYKSSGVFLANYQRSSSRINRPRVRMGRDQYQKYSISSILECR